MLSKKDKKTISTKYWNGGEQFIHPTFKDYNPHGNFHNFEGIEKQIEISVAAGQKKCMLIVMTLSEEGNPSLAQLNFDITKKSLIV